MLHRLSPARRALLFGGLAAAVVAVVALTIAVTHRGPGTTTARKDPLPPVVLVPGYGGITTGLDLMAAALRNDGRFVQVVDLGTNSLGDLHDQAEIIGATVDDVLSSTGSTSVDVVAFSAGGIATRLWVADDDGAAAKARRIVTLSSPHHGTEQSAIPTGLGPTPCPVACHQLTAGSSLLNELNHGDETPAGPDWVSIWSDDDEVVVPPTSAKLKGALDFSVQSICPDVTVSHQGMASNRVVIAMVRHEVGRAAPSKPDESVCGTPSGSPTAP
jgi:triacylglycerol esterase/lipase EstA (alpha/beta hydrolase family)